MLFMIPKTFKYATVLQTFRKPCFWILLKMKAEFEGWDRMNERFSRDAFHLHLLRAKELGQMGNKNRPSCLFHRQRSLPSILPRVRVMSISSTLCDADSNGSNPMSITNKNFDRYLKFDLHEMEPLTNVPHIQSTPENSLPLVLIWKSTKPRTTIYCRNRKMAVFAFLGGYRSIPMILGCFPGPNVQAPTFPTNESNRYFWVKSFLLLFKINHHHNSTRSKEKQIHNFCLCCLYI